MTIETRAEFDFAIIGGGTAGCVLAARLSADPDCRVILIEAGPDVVPGQEHSDILDACPVSSANPRFCWQGLTAASGTAPVDGSARPKYPYVQARCLGGASNINGMAADRAMPQDFEEWRELGVSGWGWGEVLPYFIKLESDLDFGARDGGRVHGNGGPIPIRRIPPSLWGPFCRAVGRAVGRRGLDLIEDSIGDQRDGLSAMPLNAMPQRRMSTSIAYLDAEVRARPNLQIMTNAMVERIAIEASVARGVHISTAAGARFITAREIILSAGAIQSPALLMRSGVGPAAHLRNIGIEVVRDLPGVGANLQNHPAVTLVTYLPRRSRQAADNHSMLQNWVRFSSRSAGCSDRDMGVLIFNKGSWHALGESVGALMVSVYRSYSTGTVRLISPSASVAPDVDFNLLADERDMERLVAGTRFILELLLDGEVLRARAEAFVPNGKIIGALAQRTVFNRLRAQLLAAVLNRPLLRRILLRKSRLDLQSLCHDEQALRDFVRNSAQGVYHLAGTCRMGRNDDPRAVLDSNCNVKGIENLKVIDASIFPTVPNANPHISVIMAAEKMADEIALGRARKPSHTSTVPAAGATTE